MIIEMDTLSKQCLLDHEDDVSYACDLCNDFKQP